MDNIVIFSLNGCGWSSSSLSTLKEKKIKHGIVHVSHDNKDEYKNINNMSTFPQIFYKNINNIKIKIGGNSDLNYLLDLVKATYEKKTDDSFDDMVNTIQTKLSLDKRDILRLIYLLT
mgnify:CR=1 FL=1